MKKTVLVTGGAGFIAHMVIETVAVLQVPLNSKAKNTSSKMATSCISSLMFSD